MTLFEKLCADIRTLPPAIYSVGGKVVEAYWMPFEGFDHIVYFDNGRPVFGGFQ